MRTSTKRKGKRSTKKTSRTKKPRYKYNRPEALLPIYKAFVKAVRERDRTHCQYPGCNKHRFGIEVHHSLPFSQYPKMRYDPANGVCLCRFHHKQVTGHEMAYASMFLMIARENAIKHEKRLKGKSNG
jgi:hypothetical protein